MSEQSTEFEGGVLPDGGRIRSEYVCCVCVCMCVCMCACVCLRILGEEKKTVWVLVRFIMSYAKIECCLVLFLLISCVG